MVPAAKASQISFVLTWRDTAPSWPSVLGPGAVTPCPFASASVLKACNTFSSRSPLKALRQEVCWGLGGGCVGVSYPPRFQHPVKGAAGTGEGCKAGGTLGDPWPMAPRPLSVPRQAANFSRTIHAQAEPFPARQHLPIWILTRCQFCSKSVRM